MEHFTKTVQVAKLNEIFCTEKQYLEYCFLFGAHPTGKTLTYRRKTSQHNQDNQGFQTYDV